MTFDEGDEGGDTPSRPRRKRPKPEVGPSKKFAPLPISSRFLRLMHEMSSDAMAVEAAAYYAQRDTAYARLNLTRKAMAEYVADLERRAGIQQDALTKF